ncbi:MAG: TetR/AcrR family transcriptional regulator [Candidatus Korobacteraceae bacterium]
MNTGVTAELGRRERRRVETLNRILAAAMRLFGERGYAETTVEEITEAADVGKGTFFNYFPTKDAVLMAIFEALRQRFASFEASAAEIANVRESLTRFTHGTLENVASSPRLIRSVFGHALTDPVMGERIHGVMLQARRALTAVFLHGQEMGQVRADIPAPVFARTYQQFIFGTELLWALTPGEDLHSWVDVMVETFWQGAASKSDKPRAGRERKRQ